MFYQVKSMLLSRTPVVIILGAILIVLLIYLLKRYFRSKNKKKELRQAAADRERDENLNGVILNSHASATNKEKYVPYEVNYSQDKQEGANKSSKKGADVMIQIVENTTLSSRKYVLNATKGIRIGTLEGCDITYVGDGSIEFQCQIFAIGKDVVVRNLLGGPQLILIRQKQQAIIDCNGLKLMSGDVIMMGKVSYDISLVK